MVDIRNDYCWCWLENTTNRTEQLESLLSESQKNERLLQGKIISCKEEAQKDALQSVYKNMEIIKRCEM